MTAAVALVVLVVALASGLAGITVLRVQTAKELGGDMTWWRCALGLDRPGRSPRDSQTGGMA